MSSDIDEAEDYSSIDERDPKVMDEQSAGDEDSYVNLHNKRPQHHPQHLSLMRAKPRPPQTISPVNASSLNFVDPDQIGERERELEKIHRRSRELMLSPRGLESRSRESSLERPPLRKPPPPQRIDGWKPATSSPVHHPQLASSSPPPPLPPRIQSPVKPRYHNQPPPPPPLPHRGLPPPHNPNLRRRVQSPHRRDFKDFSQQPRDFRSPLRRLPPPHPHHHHHHHQGTTPRGSYFDDEDDSGADSIDVYSGQTRGRQHRARSTLLSGGTTSPTSSALVPYDYNRGNVAGCCSGCHHHHHCPPPPSSPTNACTALQPYPSIEDRLLQLEGDKDSLHLQVALLSDQLESQTEKIGDLERVLEDKKETLRRTEDVLQRETLTRSALETKKLELMSEISGLKLRQAAIERENINLRKKLNVNDPNNSNKRNSSSELDTNNKTTIQTFGTLPRSSRNKLRSSNANSKAAAAAAPLETHFNVRSSQISEENSPPNWFQRKISNAHSGSAPNLAPDDKNVKMRTFRHQSVERVPQDQQQQQQQPQHPIATRPRGFKRILGRIRRSNSGSVNEDRKRREMSTPPVISNSAASNGNNGDNVGYSVSESGFNMTRNGRNNGFRSSAGSKFANWINSPNSTCVSGNGNYGNNDPNLPFRQWKAETICSWLDNLGLYMYNAEVQKHVKIGEQLLAMSSQDLETKLGMRNSLHRKKVLLALQAKQSGTTDQPGGLDHQWVVRWLDDVGLPQYKDTFLESRIDGRVLNFLTVDDLFQLKVTNLLHHLSIKRGIQVLRMNDFEPGCLKRRAANPEERDRRSLPTEVALWSNHRVMEWLRFVDLSEYAPNLRGSGVHGGLLILEPRFTSDLLASLLNIPPNKTLLRRHLNLHFGDLVGRAILKEKRCVEEGPHYQPLTPTAKAKPNIGTKRGTAAMIGQFSLRRKKFTNSNHRPAGDELEFDDMICPLDENDD